MGKKKRLLMKNSLKQSDNQTQSQVLNYDKKPDMEASSTRMCFLLYGLFVLVVYVYTMYPSIMGGDAGELIPAAQELGVAHPPGYPLYTMLTWLAIYIIPVEEVAWKANLLNAVFSAGAALVFALVIYRYTGSHGCAIGGSAAWCFCKLTWTWSAGAEVFGLNNFFIISLLYLMVVFQDTSHKDKPKTACLGAFVCGLSLTNQHTLVIYVTVIALWVLLELYHDQHLTFWLLVRVGLCFCGGLLPYVYLPLSAYFSHSRWTWGDQRTIAGFFKHFLRMEYGTFSLAKDKYEDETTTLTKLGMYGEHTLAEFSIIGLGLFVLGLSEAFNRAKYRRKLSLGVSLVMMLIYLIFFSWRANLNVHKPFLLGVVQRFWMQADCVFVLVAAVGAIHLERLVRSKLNDSDTTKVLMGIGVIVCAWQMQRNFSVCNQRNNRVIEEFGLRMMENVPPNTLIFTRGDLPSNVLRYLYLSTNHRPDVTVFDQEVLTIEWSVRMLRGAYPQIEFPGHHMEALTGYIQGTKIKVFNMKTFLDVNIDRFPIVACINMHDTETSWKEDYDTFPIGPCQWVYKKGTHIDIDALIKRTVNMTAGWRHPFHGLDAVSWEQVATEEMWNSKVKTGLYLYLKAKAIEEDVETRNSYILKAFEIYKNSIEAIDFETVPDYWHKNYALVCDSMLQVNHSYSNLDVAKTLVRHFDKYLELMPTDKDAPLIKDEVRNIKYKIAEFENKQK